MHSEFSSFISSFTSVPTLELLWLMMWIRDQTGQGHLMGNLFQKWQITALGKHYCWGFNMIRYAYTEDAGRNLNLVWMPIGWNLQQLLCDYRLANDWPLPINANYIVTIINRLISWPLISIFCSGPDTGSTSQCHMSVDGL